MTRINIDDDMIERAAKAYDIEMDKIAARARDYDTWPYAVPGELVREILRAALDQRTGPKDRRVEWDDTRNANLFPEQRYSDPGRRNTDGTCFYRLPRKSDRLKREAEERSKIDLDEAMAKAKRKHAEAMRLQEMKERGQ